MDAKELLGRIGKNLAVERAFGPPHQVGETMIIPVAIVGGGGGGGGGGEGTPNEGSGGGFGGVVYPLGAYVVRGESVRFVPTFDLTRLAASFLLLLRLLVKRPRRPSRHRP
jgi:uncharacterized spore protein YtfJ